MLQQATAFRPFMRHLIALTRIAVHTGNNDIPFIIRTTFSRNGYQVVNPISLLELSTAIVALAFLSLVLLLNILSGKFARNGLFPRLPITRNNSVNCSSMIGSLTCIKTRLASRIQMIWSAGIALEVLQGSRIAFSASNALLLRARGRIDTSRSWLFLPAISTCSTEAILLCLAVGKVITSCRKYLFALNTAFVAIWKSVPVCFADAVLTTLAQAIKSVGVAVKVVRGCRIFLLALSATFHGLNRLSFSCLTSSRCQGAKANTFSPGLITPLLGNMPIIAFFLNSAKAEMRGIA